ncbi:(5-formylfuran-3-yl)methyl phosphate synthase [Paraburkholderia sp. GAS334]|uniref:(5-formylfuran-3-yl)methyl phosphate synthase n=1 Tax=Paraburkholderia sp. GAS334 TaxID=3035131 RepID=UPI003D1EC07C
MTALLASVRSYDEAFDAAQAGAELIDLKEPRDGALGGVPVDEIARIVRALRAHYPVKPISAAIGDVLNDALDDIAARVIGVSDTGVDYVKVGVTAGSSARACLAHLASLPATVVPVLLCDEGVDAALSDYAAGLGFAGIVFDTASKDGRTLFDRVDMATLARCLSVIAARGAMTGVAGSLGWAQLAQIHALKPDIAGFRTALCAEGRSARLDPGYVARWAEALHHAPRETHVM